LVIVFLYETASTVMNTNYEALFPELFQAFRKRTRASATNHGLGMVGELVGFSLTPIVYTRFGFAGMAIFFAERRRPKRTEFSPAGSENGLPPGAP
jgi:Na+/melibiose symporter-like transporter